MTERGSILLKVEGLYKAFYIKKRPFTSEKKDVLNGINLHIKKGEIVFLVGPNGSGKSTLLRIIAGTILPDKGKIVWAIPKDLFHLKSILIAEPSRGLHYRISGRLNIDYMLSLLGLRVENKKLKRLITASGVEDFIDHPVKSYSKGMRTLLSIVIGLCSSAALLIIDEGLQDLSHDILRKRLFPLFREHIDRGGAILIASPTIPDFPFDMPFCQYKIENGRIYQ